MYRWCLCRLRVQLATHTKNATLILIGSQWNSGNGGPYILAPLALWGATGVATLMGVKEGLEEMLAD